MAPTIVAQTRPASNVVPIRHALARAQATVDHLHELRSLLRHAQETERTLTRELIETMQARGLRMLQGTQAVAVLEERTSLAVDPALFLEAAGPRAPEALAVHVTKARALVGEEILEAISETVTTAVLRVEPAPRRAA